MKIKDLIEQLKSLPQEDEILCLRSDDILGYYSLEEPRIEKETAIKHENGYECPISNWTPEKGQAVKVWVIGS